MSLGYADTARRIMLKDGIKGFYRGFFPPFFGAMMYRSAQFSIFEAFYTGMKDNRMMCSEIPYSGGLEWRTPIAGFLGGSVRALIECPFEYAKVKR